MAITQNDIHNDTIKITYDILKKTSKEPQLVSYNGRVWIYTYKTNNFLEKIKNIIATTLVYILAHFTNTKQSYNQKLLIDAEERIHGPYRTITTLEGDKLQLSLSLQEKQLELQSTITAKKQLEKHLGDKTKEWNEVTAKFNAKVTECQALSNKFEIKNTDWQEVTAAKNDLEMQLAANTQEIAALQLNLQQVTNDLANTTTELQGMTATKNDLEMQLAAKTKELEDAVQLSEKNLNETVTTKTQEIAALQLQLISQEKTLTGAIELAVKNGQSESLALQKQLASKETEITALKQEIATEKLTHKQNLDDVSIETTQLKNEVTTLQETLRTHKESRATEIANGKQLSETLLKTVEEQLDNHINALQKNNSGQVRKNATDRIMGGIQGIVDHFNSLHNKEIK